MKVLTAGDVENLPHVTPPKRLFVDNGMMTIPAGTSAREAVLAVLDALADGRKFVVLDKRDERERGRKGGRP
jgi:hypothetical protein